MKKPKRFNEIMILLSWVIIIILMIIAKILFF